MHDYTIFLFWSVLSLTILAAVGAAAMLRFGPSPPTPFSERLFDTLVSLTSAGFFTVLGLLAATAQSH